MNLRDIADREGLKYVETTDSPNGYPQNIRGAIIGFRDFEEIEDIAEEYGLSISSLTKKDGWCLYRRLYSRTGPFNMMNEYSADQNMHLYEKSDLDNFFENHIRWNLEDCVSFDDLESYIASQKEIIERIEDSEDDEFVIAFGDSYYKTCKYESVEFHEDNSEFVICVM